MSAMQSDIIAALGVAPTIDPDTEITRRVQFLVDYLDATGAKGYVLGISGGQDSTLAGRLAQLAVEQRRADGNDATFVAVRLPHGVQAHVRHGLHAGVAQGLGLAHPGVVWRATRQVGRQVRAGGVRCARGGCSGHHVCQPTASKAFSSARRCGVPTSTQGPV